MESGFNIAIVNHSFQINYYSRRWQLFAEKHPNCEVTLIAPREHEWYKGKGYTFSGAVKMTSTEIDSGNFHRRLINMSKLWYSDDYKPLFDEIQPDVVYLVGGMPVLMQLLKLRDKYYPTMKVINFNMRGPASDVRYRFTFNPVQCALNTYHYFMARSQIRFYNNHLDAQFCHYPDAVECFKKEGYQGPIYMQTQVGVNTEWFHPDEEARKEIREKYNIAPTTYVFGSATRFTIDKGIDDIVNALPLEGDWKYIMMGTGSNEEINRIKSLVSRRGLGSKIIMSGMIDWYEIAKYWNAIDCCIHVPRTTEHWVETFSLSVIQPQATQKPVIGNTSGSVPYQIGFDEMIVPEGDIASLNDKIVWALNHRAEMEKMGHKMYERTLNSFSVQHLNDMFYDTIVEDVLTGRYDINKYDMTSYIPKNHE